MLKKKSQSSLEFLMIFGIGFTIILILSAIFFNYFNAEKNSLDNKHISNLGNQLMQNTEKIYFLGAGNRVTINTNFPEQIKNMNVVHKNNVTVDGKQTSFDYLNITMNNNVTHIFTANENYIRFNCGDCYHNLTNNISYVNDSSFLTAGRKKIRIENRGDFVEISFVR